MLRTSVSVCVLLLVIGLFAGMAVSQTGSSEVEVSIVVSPSTINIQSKGVWVTVHADIPYSEVADAIVTLDDVDVEVVCTKSDARGDLVAKFDVDAIKDIVDPGTAELELSVITVSGERFYVTDTVTVIDESGGDK